MGSSVGEGAWVVFDNLITFVFDTIGIWLAHVTGRQLGSGVPNTCFPQL